MRVGSPEYQTPSVVVSPSSTSGELGPPPPVTMNVSPPTRVESRSAGPVVVSASSTRGELGPPPHVTMNVSPPPRVESRSAGPVVVSETQQGESWAYGSQTRLRAWPAGSSTPTVCATPAVLRAVRAVPVGA